MVNDVVAALRVLDVEERLGALVSVVEGEDVGAVAVVDAEDGYVAGSMPALVADDVLADANVLMATETSQTIAYDTSRVLIDVVAPRPVMLIFGAGHVAQPLSRIRKFAILSGNSGLGASVTKSMVRSSTTRNAVTGANQERTSDASFEARS